MQLQMFVNKNLLIKLYIYETVTSKIFSKSSIYNSISYTNPSIAHSFYEDTIWIILPPNRERKRDMF